MWWVEKAVVYGGLLLHTRPIAMSNGILWAKNDLGTLWVRKNRFCMYERSFFVTKSPVFLLFMDFKWALITDWSLVQVRPGPPMLTKGFTRFSVF